MYVIPAGLLAKVFGSFYQIGRQVNPILTSASIKCNVVLIFRSFDHTRQFDRRLLKRTTVNSFFQRCTGVGRFGHFAASLYLEVPSSHDIKM